MEVQGCECSRLEFENYGVICRSRGKYSKIFTRAFALASNILNFFLKRRKNREHFHSRLRRAVKEVFCQFARFCIIWKNSCGLELSRQYHISLWYPTDLVGITWGSQPSLIALFDSTGKISETESKTETMPLVLGSESVLAARCWGLVTFWKNEYKAHNETRVACWSSHESSNASELRLSFMPHQWLCTCQLGNIPFVLSLSLC